MAEIQVEVTDGPFAGLPAVLVSHVDDRVRVHVNLFGRETPLELQDDQVRLIGIAGAEGSHTAGVEGSSHASLRERIVAEHERLAATETFRFFLERVDEAETNLACEWDSYLAHRDETETRVQEHLHAALDEFDRQLASLPVAEAEHVIAGDVAFWHPGTIASSEQRAAFPEPDAEQRLLAAIVGEPLGVSAHERARERLEQARLAAEERDYERWKANLPPNERQGYPSRGNPARYAYARAPRHDVSLPPDRSVEWAVRSECGVGSGPIPQEALDAVEGLSLNLHRPADLTPLLQLRNLRRLSVKSGPGLDVAALAAVLRPARKLRSLSIEAPVRDIGPLARLTQLRLVQLDDTRITDLAPLSNLTRLSILSVSGGPLSDLSPVSGLRLERLFIDGTQVSDLAPLAGMATLDALGLFGCPVRDLDVIATLPALRFVRLPGTRLADVGDLPEQFPGVTFDTVGEHAPATEPFVGGYSAAAAPADPIPDPVAADLRAAFHAAGDDYQRRGRLERAMLAARRVDLVQEIVDTHHDGQRSTVAGLFLRGGVGDVPFPDNPWGIPADAGLAEALTQVFAPVAGFAPRFVAAAHDRTLGLALLLDENDTPALGYLTWKRGDDGPEQLAATPDSLERFADPTRDFHLSLVVGSAPYIADATAVVPLLSGPVPRPVRDFWAIHYSLDYGWGSIGGGLDCNTLEFHDGDSWSVVAERLGGLPPDRFAHSVGSANYDIYVLDLHMLDAGGNPTVAHWAFKERQLDGHRQYWEWLDTTGTNLIFRT